MTKNGWGVAGSINKTNKYWAINDSHILQDAKWAESDPRFVSKKKLTFLAYVQCSCLRNASNSVCAAESIQNFIYESICQIGQNIWNMFGPGGHCL